MKLARLAASSIVLFGLAVPGTQTAAAAVGTVKAVTDRFTPEYRAYAQVQPRTLVTVRAAATGVIAALSVLPGERVHPGAVLARLTGPDYDAALAAARARQLAAQSNLKVVRDNYPQFSSVQDIVNATAAFQQSHATLSRLQAAGRVLAPLGGVVLTVAAANGERVTAGQTIITLQPNRQLWLRAAYYGTDAAAIRVGMRGEYSPADGARPIPVKVATVFGMLNPDGGESIGLLATLPTPEWLNGEFGTLLLKGPVRQLPVVPTSALILDKGRWWVLIHTDHGSQPQRVTPGPTRGWLTFIERGLKPGEDVTVENAYLKFHRAIAKHYTPPD